MSRVAVTNSWDEKLGVLRDRLEVARAEVQRQSQYIGERLGAIAATKAAQRPYNRLIRQIESLEFDRHNAGDCNPETCSDCHAHKLAPNQWIARGAQLKNAKLDFDDE